MSKETAIEELTCAVRDLRPELTLRDYFAGQVIAGIAGAGAFRDLGDSFQGNVWDGKEKIESFLVNKRAPVMARIAYGAADAMLEARVEK